MYMEYQLIQSSGMLCMMTRFMYYEGETMSYEPPLDDPVATGESDECEDCGCFIYECVCNEPDRMYGDED